MIRASPTSLVFLFHRLIFGKSFQVILTNPRWAHHHSHIFNQAYLYRKIFEEFFPTSAAAETVPIGPSIACSTPRALEWDKSFKV